MSSEEPSRIEARVTAAWQRIPRRVRLVTLIVVVGGASFAATILPFVIADRSSSVVEIAGHLPATATVGQPLNFDIAADNTGNGNVQPLCIKVTTDPGVTKLTAVFQGLDHVAGTGDHVCGGTLSGSETTSIHLQFVPTTPGVLQVRLVVMEGTKEIGPARQGTVVVSAAP